MQLCSFLRGTFLAGLVFSVSVASLSAQSARDSSALSLAEAIALARE
jgi:hypothetical protein